MSEKDKTAPLPEDSTRQRTPETERRRPALVIVFNIYQVATMAVVGVAVSVGFIFWMATVARYQAISVDRLDAIRQEGAVLNQTVMAHVRVVQADNEALLFYARAVCEELARFNRQPPEICNTSSPVRRRP